LVTRLEFPRLPLPQGSWEYQIGRAYGRAAFDLAYVLDDGTQPEVAAFWYRRAIEYDPDLAGAYKNLGLVLDRLGDADGVIAVWSKYLELNPTDPQADAMQTRVEQLLESR
jgi:tetratricopeptide (TPR) repeat protein